MRVLVIDDERAILEMISDMLEPEGYEVLRATDGRQGMDMIRNTPDIDIVITDLIMPEKDGLETIGELKEDFPKTKILAISGGGQTPPEIYLRLGQNLGADLTLRKPFTEKQLLECLEAMV